MSTCSVTGCGQDVYARTLCRMHYVRLLRHGDTARGRLQTRCGYVLTNLGRASAGLPLRYVEAEP